ncbi:type IV secretion protein Rhs, partial [Salmonella enterica subsp. enterica serovar Uganda]|nr:type IV secretion protein Rhs [Salmonella enterica subsp. enterica serovar Rough O:k:1,5]EDX2370393.1 type IV secretion protein Rhs [Salmonella enterica subsp. enterica serovar Memphis]EED8909270.1 type IV secretion protein Rhs [Salmonella enterica subsp. enterica]EED9616899.1 type IV secretion protein Rhs [Salmonella enterica subsp. enterica serovar Memphis]EHK4162603.1 HNH endonuclease [Salmonella enterica]
GGLNLYSYAPNPLSWIDPLGLALTGVDFTGSLDLFPVKGNQLNIVEITMQGSRGRDFTEAFKKAGITKAESTGYTWHHLDDFDPTTGKTTMQLVKTSAHEGTFPHAGSVSQFEKHFNLPSGSYGSSDAIAISPSKGWLAGRIPKALKRGCS